jgi:hypothetical protein
VRLCILISDVWLCSFPLLCISSSAPHPGDSAFSVLGWFNNNQVTRAAVGSASGAFLPTLTALLGNVAYFLAGTAPQVFPRPIK